MTETPSQADKARAFKALHIAGDPVILCNIWDAGSAKTVAKAGAAALATGSWSIAAAHGYPDGQALPLEDLLRIADRICHVTELPVSVDFEGGYATDPKTLTINAERLISTGIAGLNFEDRIVGGTGLHGVGEQARRIAALRKAAETTDVPIFLNARTDTFFQGQKSPDHAALLPDALARAEAYAEAGADGLFVPGLTDPDLIKQLSARSPLPVNVMLGGNHDDVAPMTALGVSRISFGPTPYLSAMQTLSEQARWLYKA